MYFLYNRVMTIERMAERLRRLAPEEVLFVAESGIQTAEDIAVLRRAKVNGVLIGETLVNAILQLVQQGITLTSLVALLIRFSPWLAVIGFVSAIPSFLAQSQYAERAFRAFRKPIRQIAGR